MANDKVLLALSKLLGVGSVPVEEVLLVFVAVDLSGVEDVTVGVAIRVLDVLLPKISFVEMLIAEEMDCEGLVKIVVKSCECVLDVLLPKVSLVEMLIVEEIDCVGLGEIVVKSDECDEECSSSHKTRRFR